MQVLDKFRQRTSEYVFGYCGCGREVKYPKDVECPCCKAKLEWGDVKKVEYR